MAVPSLVGEQAKGASRKGRTLPCFQLCLLCRVCCVCVTASCGCGWCAGELMHASCPDTRDGTVRDTVSDALQALPKLLRCVQWSNREAVREMHTLLTVWKKLSAAEALMLLDLAFPDPSVRAFAVSCLEPLSDEDLHLYMLQLVQVWGWLATHVGMCWSLCAIRCCVLVMWQVFVRVVPLTRSRVCMCRFRRCALSTHTTLP